MPESGARSVCGCKGTLSERAYHRLVLFSKDYNGSTVVPVTPEDCETSRATVTGLEAHVTYEVKVTFRPRGGRYWSEWKGSSGTTSEDGAWAAQLLLLA